MKIIMEHENKTLPTYAIGIIGAGIAVNFAPFTLSQVTIMKLLNLLHEYKVDAKHIMLEVTDRNFEGGFSFLTPLKALQDAGFRISMDDFSVGHSSFALLALFNFDEIKRDLALLPKDEKDFEGQVIYENIVKAVAHKDAKLVAKGIEIPFHLDFLTKLGVHTGQGYHLSRPLSRKDFINLLKDTKTPTN